MIRDLTTSHPARAGNVDAARLNPSGAPEDARRWLQEQSRTHAQHDLTWLLAHADDGVIWGRIDPDDGTLVTSHEAAAKGGADDALAVCPSLRTRTLQQARLFGAGGELLLWRQSGGPGRAWRARLIHDVDDQAAADWTESFAERQLLWGTGGRKLDRDFFFWRHGAEGLRHALPFRPDGSGSGDAFRPRRLVVRHYLCGEGVARVVTSRLVGFHPKA